MKKDSVKYIVLIVFSLATLVLLILNAVFDFNVFWTVNISDGIEIFVLIFVSYFLVDRQNEKDRKKEKINALINKVQLRLLDADLVKVDTEENRKITRIKVTSISNLLEIIKDNMDNKNNIVVCVPDDLEKVKKGIKALEYQISVDTNEYDRKIHQYALSCYKKKLKEIN